MDIFKVLGLIFITAVIAVILKQQKSEFSLLILIICGIIVLNLIVNKILIPITVITEKIESYGVSSEFFKVALKALGIGYITTFIANLCKDAGLSSLAFKAELAGKCAIFMLCVPLILSVLETAIGFIK